MQTPGRKWMMSARRVARLRKAAGDPNPSNRLSSRAASVRRAILASEIAVGILIGR